MFQLIRRKPKGIVFLHSLAEDLETEKETEENGAQIEEHQESYIRPKLIVGQFDSTSKLIPQKSRSKSCDESPLASQLKVYNQFNLKRLFKNDQRAQFCTFDKRTRSENLKLQDKILTSSDFFDRRFFAGLQDGLTHKQATSNFRKEKDDLPANQVGKNSSPHKVILLNWGNIDKMSPGNLTPRSGCNEKIKPIRTQNNNRIFYRMKREEDARLQREKYLKMWRFSVLRNEYIKEIKFKKEELRIYNDSKVNTENRASKLNNIK